MKYIFTRHSDNSPIVLFLKEDGQVETITPNASRARINYNVPFDWGNAGSGCSQLSHAILLHHCALNGIPAVQADSRADAFKWAFLAHIDTEGGFLSSLAITTWLDQQIRRNVK
jgi:hypothetical protein